MQYRVCFLMLLMNVLIGNIRAQHQATVYKVNFNTDEHVLDKSDEMILNQLIAATQKASYYEISLAAHTDSDADNVYNIKLSQRRAQSVTDYLLANNINSKHLVSKSFGERNPEANNNNENGKAINRRVDITLNTFTINSTSDLLKQVSPDYKQVFTIDASKPNTIRGNKGTSVTIPANALVTKSGKTVTGKVEVVLNEFLKPADAAFNLLSTMSHGKLLESGGMFSITATANKEEVVLKPGSKVDVNMPTINMKNEMTLFTAVKNNQGITEWKPTNIPFRPLGVAASSSAPFVMLDEKYLKSLMTDCGEKPVSASYFYKLPTAPKRPATIPKEPVYKEPVLNNEFPWYERIILSKKELEKRFDAVVTRRRNYFEKRMAIYEKVRDRLEPEWKQYKRDSAAFENAELNKFREWLAQQKILHEAHADYIEKSQWNMALQSLINKSNSNEITQANIRKRFQDDISSKSPYFSQVWHHKYALSMIHLFSTMSMTGMVNMFGNNKPASLSFTNEKNKRYSLRMPDGTFAELQLHSTPELMKILGVAENKLVKKQLAARAFNESNVGDVYTIALSNFGTFNCDRFSTTPPERMAKITIPTDNECRLSFYVPSINSYIYAYMNNEGYYVNLPKGVEVKMVYVSFVKGTGPLMQIENHNFKSDTRIVLKPKAVSLDEMKNAIASIGS